MAEQLGLQQVEVIDDEGRRLDGVGVAEESLQEVIDAREDGAGSESGTGDTEGNAQRPVPAGTAKTAAPDTAQHPARDSESGQFVKQTRGQKRFDQLTREREDARREALAEKTAREALEREYNELKARQSAPAAPSTAAGASAAPVAPSHAPVAQADAVAAKQAAAGIRPSRTQPSEDDIGTKYQTYAEFVADTGRWVMEQGVSDPQSPLRQAMREELLGWQQEQVVTGRKRELATNWETAQQRGRQKYQDFDRVVAPLLTVTLEGPILDTLAAHPHADDLVYRLMSDPALSSAFAGPQADPIQRAMILGQLTAQTAGAAAPASARSVASSTAPPPYKPVGGNAKTTSPSLEELADAGDYDAYYARVKSDLRR